MRWWAVYTVNNATHRIGVRTANGVTSAQANTFFHTLFNTHAPVLNSVVPLTLEFAVQGSNVRNLSAWTGSASYGIGVQDGNDRRARFTTYVGRSTDGRKSKLYLFGLQDISEGDYRVSGAESAVVQAFLNILNVANGVYLSISGQQPVWKGYANVAFHNHWVKQFRKLGG